jgi:2'-5' RNA ligase
MDLINRTFIGVRVPPELFATIDHALMHVKRKPGILDMRWNQPSEYLLTLVSLGELSVESISRVNQAIGPIISQFPQFSLVVEKFSGLPNMIQPRFAVLHLSGEGAETSIQLAQSLDAATRNLTPPREGKPFQPNIVMGRIKTESEQMRVALGRALKLPEHPPYGLWNVTHVELLISSASTSGMGYKTIESFPLRA